MSKMKPLLARVGGRKQEVEVCRRERKNEKKRISPDAAGGERDLLL